MFVASFEQLNVRIMNEVIKLMFSKIVSHVLRRESTMETLKMFPEEEEDLQTLTYGTDLKDSAGILWTVRCLLNF